MSKEYQNVLVLGNFKYCTDTASIVKKEILITSHLREILDDETISLQLNWQPDSFNWILVFVRITYL